MSKRELNRLLNDAANFGARANRRRGRGRNTVTAAQANQGPPPAPVPPPIPIPPPPPPNPIIGFTGPTPVRFRARRNVVLNTPDEEPAPPPVPTQQPNIPITGRPRGTRGRRRISLRNRPVQPVAPPVPAPTQQIAPVPVRNTSTRRYLGMRGGIRYFAPRTNPLLGVQAPPRPLTPQPAFNAPSPTPTPPESPPTPTNRTPIDPVPNGVDTASNNIEEWYNRLVVTVNLPTRTLTGDTTVQVPILRSNFTQLNPPTLRRLRNALDKMNLLTNNVTTDYLLNWYRGCILLGLMSPNDYYAVTGDRLITISTEDGSETFRVPTLFYFLLYFQQEGNRLTHETVPTVSGPERYFPTEDMRDDYVVYHYHNLNEDPEYQDYGVNSLSDYNEYMQRSSETNYIMELIMQRFFGSSGDMDSYTTTSSYRVGEFSRMGNYLLGRTYNLAYEWRRDSLLNDRIPYAPTPRPPQEGRTRWNVDSLNVETEQAGYNMVNVEYQIQPPNQNEPTIDRTLVQTRLGGNIRSFFNYYIPITATTPAYNFDDDIGFGRGNIDSVNVRQYGLRIFTRNSPLDHFISRGLFQSEFALQAFVEEQLNNIVQNLDFTNQETYPSIQLGLVTYTQQGERRAIWGNMMSLLTPPQPNQGRRYFGIPPDSEYGSPWEGTFFVDHHPAFLRMNSLNGERFRNVNVTTNPLTSLFNNFRDVGQRFELNSEDVLIWARENLPGTYKNYSFEQLAERYVNENRQTLMEQFPELDDGEVLEEVTNSRGIRVAYLVIRITNNFRDPNQRIRYDNSTTLRGLLARGLGIRRPDMNRQGLRIRRILGTRPLTVRSRNLLTNQEETTINNLLNEPDDQPLLPLLNDSQQPITQDPITQEQVDDIPDLITNPTDTDYFTQALFNPDLFEGGKGLAYTKVYKDYFILSPASIKNCGFQVLYALIHWKKHSRCLSNKLFLQKKGSWMKGKVKVSAPEVDCNFADIENAAKHFKKRIQVYNNAFRLLADFMHGDDKLMMQIGNSGSKQESHYRALFRRAEIEKKLPQFDFKDFPTVDEYLGKVKKKHLYLLNNGCYLYGEEVKTEEEITELLGEKDPVLPKDEKPRMLPKKSYKPHLKEEWRLGSFDLEATRDTENAVTEGVPFKAYALGFAYKTSEEFDKHKYVEFYGLNCVNQFLDYLFDNAMELQGYIFYAHNATFDLSLILREGLLTDERFLIIGDQWVELNSKILCLSLCLRENTGVRFTFRDSLNQLPGSLDSITRAFKVPHQKLTGDVDHEQINLDNFDSEPLMTSIKKYLMYDVLGLLEVMERYNRKVWETKELNVCYCHTTASLAKVNFFKHHYDPKHQPIYHLPDWMDDYIRKSFKGGRVGAEYLGHFKGTFYYRDFTSLYPSVMEHNLYPYGYPEYILNMTPYISPINTLKPSFFGYVRVRVKSVPKPNYTGLHGVNYRGKLCFPYFNDWTELVLFSEEIRLGQEQDLYEYMYLDGIKFKSTRTLFTKLVQDGFKEKAECKAKGDKPGEQASKLILNTSYGLWSLKVKDRDSTMVCSNDNKTWVPYAITNKLKTVARQGDYTFARVVKDLLVEDFNIAIGAAVTSYARMKIYKVITQIKKKGGKVYYYDTDSVITDYDITQDDQLYEMYMWDCKGEALGTLKNECIDKVLTKVPSDMEKNQFLNKELHVEGLQEEDLLRARDSQACFDEVIICGCKMYYCERKMRTNPSKSIVASAWKGFKRCNKHNCQACKDGNCPNQITKQKYLDMTEGEVIEQEQVQFRTGKKHMVDETLCFSVNLATIQKKFKKVYDKGVLLEIGPNQYEVKPLHLNEDDIQGESYEVNIDL